MSYPIWGWYLRQGVYEQLLEGHKLYLGNTQITKVYVDGTLTYDWDNPQAVTLEWPESSNSYRGSIAGTYSRNGTSSDFSINSNITFYSSADHAIYYVSINGYGAYTNDHTQTQWTDNPRTFIVGGNNRTLTQFFTFTVAPVKRVYFISSSSDTMAVDVSSVTGWFDPVSNALRGVSFIGTTVVGGATTSFSYTIDINASVLSGSTVSTALPGIDDFEITEGANLTVNNLDTDDVNYLFERTLRYGIYPQDAWYTDPNSSSALSSIQDPAGSANNILWIAASPDGKPIGIVVRRDADFAAGPGLAYRHSHTISFDVYIPEIPQSLPADDNPLNNGVWVRVWGYVGYEDAAWAPEHSFNRANFVWFGESTYVEEAKITAGPAANPNMQMHIGWNHISFSTHGYKPESWTTEQYNPTTATDTYQLSNIRISIWSWNNQKLAVGLRNISLDGSRIY